MVDPLRYGGAPIGRGWTNPSRLEYGRPGSRTARQKINARVDHSVSGWTAIVHLSCHLIHGNYVRPSYARSHARAPRAALAATRNHRGIRVTRLAPAGSRQRRVRRGALDPHEG